ncbi:HesA/MoeB/ThiF family protein [Loigolactobacillus jiayinensis]|uniref:HesA/MoeB/ThiF family protein n=1 Tax=Loigolactobacillus jiayinensis TaxID=2486016 RepID=A0ABW1RDF8_9LACO|nr:HesA/MoeB/ThiF family protein [Loigolactobacillus jiayinensis]
MNIIERYDRQIRVKQIGAAGQAEISASTIMLVGCGALGTYAAEQLVRAGVGTLYLVDPDTVSETNLQRQSLFTEADAANELFKVDAAAAKLRQINHEVQIEVFPVELRPELLAQMQPLTLALDCSDNFSVRDMLNRLALNQHFPFVFAACAGVSGQLMLLNPSQGPCLECVFPDLTKLKERDCDILGVATPLIPLVSSLQVAIAMRYIVSGEGALDQLTTVSCWPPAQQTFHVKKQPDCPVCQHEQVSIKLNDRTLLRRLCGSDAWSVYLPQSRSITEVTATLAANQVAYRVTPSMVTFTWHEAPASYFKTGKVQLYKLNEQQAQQHYRALWQLLKAPIKKEGQPQ